MNIVPKQDLRIVGKSTAAGGLYEQVHIEGECQVSGNLTCTLLESIGKFEIKGNVNADKVKLNGHIQIDGNFISSDEVAFDGKVNITGYFSGKQVELKGFTTIDHDFEAVQLNVRGGFTIGGRMSAEQMDIQLYTECQVKEVRADRIVVKRGTVLTYLNKLFKSIFHSYLIADNIEGDEIYLENTKARLVRGGNVTIGTGCEIETVEYTELFEQHECAKVGRHIHV